MDQTMSPPAQAHSLLSEPPGKPKYNVSAMEIVEMSGKFNLCFWNTMEFFPQIFSMLQLNLWICRYEGSTVFSPLQISNS